MKVPENDQGIPFWASSSWRGDWASQEIKENSFDLVALKYEKKIET